MNDLIILNLYYFLYFNDHYFVTFQIKMLLSSDPVDIKYSSLLLHLTLEILLECPTPLKKAEFFLTHGYL